MTRGQAEPARAEALRVEQEHVSMLYGRLDAERERAEKALKQEHARGGADGTRQALVERDAWADRHARRLAQLSGVEHGLCFGRLDDTDGDTHYIGRIGLRDDEYDSVLVDWRAPAARPFYTAIPSDPGPVVRRRHLHTRGRTVVDIDDEVFDLDRMSDADRRSLVGEAALLASLRRGRTGRMSEVVATIQTEQDRVIRSGLPGALVVQGGPGTGKTVAALHRAAYLLYAHRDTLERRGVLVVGPNATFSRYIERVLPSLGETDVVLSSLGELYPGVHATEVDEPAAAVVKGDLRMVDVLRTAVADRQRAPRDGVEVAIPVKTSVRGGVEVVVEEMTLRLDHDTCVRARDRARTLPQPHNVARKLFVNEMLTALAHHEAEQLDHPPLDAEDLRYARTTLWGRKQVRAALNGLWPLLTPERLIGELFSDADALRSAGEAGGLSADEQRALLRPAQEPWTVGDIPLLDEAAELLGTDDTATRQQQRAAERDRHAEERYAQGVLEITGLTGMAGLDADVLAERQLGNGPAGTTATRAAADRSWAYGHVIVDEAQELSAMAWRTVMRRIPTRSLTVVGDIAQAGSPAGARSWGEMLDRYLEGRWREERLLINYRTPAEIMDVAADVLTAVAPDQEPPESVRDGEVPPRAVRAADEDLPETLRRLVRTELAEIGEGRLAVVTPGARRAGIAAQVTPEESAALDVLDRPVAVVTVSQSKGLEFDAVIVVAPDEIVAESPKGGHDLYVAITRATRRLTVVYEEELPEVLRRMATNHAGAQ